MNNCAIYLYGIIPVHSASSFNILGIDKINQLYSLDFEDLKAMVSDVPLVDYDEISFTKNAEDIEWLKEKAFLHSNIISHIFNITNAIVPIKFGTIFLCKDNIFCFLKENYQALKDNLINTANKQEWGVKLYCDINMFIDTNMTDEKKKILEQTSNISKGARYFLHKKLEDNISNMAKNKILILSKNIFDNLLSECSEGKFNKLLSKEATGMPFEMYMNSTFLLSKKHVQHFIQTLDIHKDELKKIGVYLEQTGPWPPYNFCTLS